MKRLKSNLSNPLIIAIDDLNKEITYRFVEELAKVGVFNNGVWGVKLSGAELNNRDVIFDLQNVKGVPEKPEISVFSDPLLLCMPNRIASLLSSYTPARFISIHALGGLPLLREAARFQKSCPTSRVVPLTVPTYFDEATCDSILGRSVEAAVLKFAEDIAFVGLEYLICPPRELKILNQYPEFQKMQKIVPAVRPKWFRKKGIHQETMTPREAIEAGATYLAIGDPIVEPIVNFHKNIRKGNYKNDPQAAEKQAWEEAVRKSISAIGRILDEISDHLLQGHISFIEELNRQRESKS